MPKGEKHHNLQEYLEGKYKPKDPNEEHQYRSTMRRRVKRDMRFLKLVLEKAESRDLYMIFSKDEKESKEVMWPVVSRLFTLIADYLPSDKERMRKGGWLPSTIKVLVSLCEKNGLKLSVSRFLENVKYRKKKIRELGEKIPELKKKTEFKKWTSDFSEANMKELGLLLSSG